MMIIRINKRIKPIFIVVLGLMALCVVVILIFNNTSSRTSICKDCNILLISIDTLSANHLPCYGYERNTAPNLCQLGNDNIIFKNAFSNAPWTLPSHVSIFTSLYPGYHGVINRGDALSKEIPFLPEILQKNGYETYFYIPGNDNGSLPIKDVYSRGITKIFPYNINSYEEYFPYLKSGLNYFLSNIKEGKKTFTFLHTYYVHSPYLIENREKIYTKDNFENIPLNYKEFFSLPITSEIYKEILNEGSLNNKPDYWKNADKNFYEDFKNAKTLEEAEKILEARVNSSFWVAYNIDHNYERKIDINNEKQIEYIRALYDQKINEFDKWIGDELIPFLEDPAIKENTIVIITSDHGEQFMEHGGIAHGMLYYSDTKIPLILYIPGVKNKIIKSPVQSVDITPTILDAAGIPIDKFLFQGQSLLDLIYKGIEKSRLLIADGWGNTTKTIRKGDWKLFLTKDENDKYIPYELYDIKLDQNELDNVLSQYIGVANELIKGNNSYDELWGSLLKPRPISE